MQFRKKKTKTITMNIKAKEKMPLNRSKNITAY
jgi:hypothetical protein